MVDTSFSYGLSELLFEVNTLRRPTSHPPWQGRPRKFKSRELHTVDTLADFCTVEWCNSWYFTCQNFL